MNSGSTNAATVVRIHRFPGMQKAMLARISAGRGEAAKVWTQCRDLHLAARKAKTAWPGRNELQQATKGGFGLHSQSAQMVCHAFLANIDTAQQLRTAGNQQMKYPWRDKRYYPLIWPAQAMAVKAGQIILPMGRGRKSIVLPAPEGFVPGGCKLVWNGTENELHVSVQVVTQAAETDTGIVATADLGQIHQVAVTTNTGQALIVSGRGQRSLKRKQNKMHGEIARLQSRCKKGSRRYKKLARSRHKHAGRVERQIRDLAHKGTRAVADFCAINQVSRLFVGDPHGVRNHNNGRKHNQRMAQWEYGRDKQYLAQKLGRSSISSFSGSERGTSSRCPICGHKHKPKGRVWRCSACGFTGHRDLVGSANMHEDNFEKLTTFPSLKDVTYLRPRATSMVQAGRIKTCRPGSSSRPDTGRGEAQAAPVLLFEAALDTACVEKHSAPFGAGHLCGLSTEARRF